jgi:hypothetical protein
VSRRAGKLRGRGRLVVVLGLAALAIAGPTPLGPEITGRAIGERAQRGNLIVSLDGRLTPLRLPRDRPAPVAVRLEGGLRTDDGSLLPRVTRVEVGLPAQGVVSARGLPICPQRRLRHAKSPEALAACRAALVGHGRLQADVRLPRQARFRTRARLLLFNGRLAGGRRAVILHAYAARPPTTAVIAFAIRRRAGRFGTVLVGDLPAALGPWPRLAHFEMTLSRRYSDRGAGRSYLSASCPIPPRFTAGFFSFARATFTLVGGRRIGTGIARSCRAG